jgi:nicotinamide-nucleotide amidase
MVYLSRNISMKVIFMRAEILSIGTELLLGQIIDTNAAWLAERLAELGIGIYNRQTVGDNDERLSDAIRLAKSRADLIICTGGLGPTGDDITSANIARVFDAPLVLNPEAKVNLEAWFARRSYPLTEKQFKQAMLPTDSMMILNPTGTAPGFILDKDGVIIMAFPGPPLELYPMWRETAEPYLRKREENVIHSITLRFCGIGEAALESLLQDLMDNQTTTTIAPYAKTGEVHIRLTARAASVDEAKKMIGPLQAEVMKRAGKYMYGVNDETLEVATGKILRQRGMTLAVAESCTGGTLGGRITSVAGASEYFVGGIIAYENRIKEELLRVPAKLLTQHGAVSEECAKAMADGVRITTGADIGISITGIAGPGGGTPEKPVGLVYIGISAPQFTTIAIRGILGSDREMIRIRAATQALLILRDYLTGAGVII